MPDAAHVGGADKIRAVAAALRHLGTDRTIINEAAKNIRAAAPDLRKAIKASAIAVLPKTGGLGTWVSKASIRVQILRSGRRAGITLVVGRDSEHGRTDMKRIDAGSVRHPTYGNRKKWTLQTVTPGFATDVMNTDAAEALRRAAEDALDVAVEKVLRVL